MSAFSTFQAVYHPVGSIVWFIACLTVSHLTVNNKPRLLTCMNNYNNVIIYNRVKLTLVWPPLPLIWGTLVLFLNSRWVDWLLELYLSGKPLTSNSSDRKSPLHRVNVTWFVLPLNTLGLHSRAAFHWTLNICLKVNATWNSYDAVSYISQLMIFFHFCICCLSSKSRTSVMSKYSALLYSCKMFFPW